MSDLPEFERNAIRQHWSHILCREIRDEELESIDCACQDWVIARLKSYPTMANQIHDLQEEIQNLRLILKNTGAVIDEPIQKLEESEQDSERLDWLLQRAYFVGLEVHHIPIVDRASIDEARKSVTEPPKKD
jgi:hypothetical protein